MDACLSCRRFMQAQPSSVPLRHQHRRAQNASPTSKLRRRVIQNLIRRSALTLFSADGQRRHKEAEEAEAAQGGDDGEEGVRGRRRRRRRRRGATSSSSAASGGAQEPRAAPRGEDVELEELDEEAEPAVGAGVAEFAADEQEQSKEQEQIEAEAEQSAQTERSAQAEGAHAVRACTRALKTRARARTHLRRAPLHLLTSSTPSSTLTLTPAATAARGTV